jgi:hypothetical protein
MFRRKNVAKGLAAGAIGGLVGTIVMTQFQNAWQKSSRSLKREEESQPEVMSSSAQAEETWGIQTGTEGASRSTAKVYSVRQTGAEKEGADKKEQSGNKENKEDDNATTKVAEAVAKVGGRHLAPGQKKTGGTIVHYVFGTLMGAAYGVAVELGSRRIRRNQLLSGLGFGAALFAGADEVAVPALRLTQPPSEVPTVNHLYGFASHLVYGTTAVAVCNATRKFL